MAAEPNAAIDNENFLYLKIISAQRRCYQWGNFLNPLGQCILAMNSVEIRVSFDTDSDKINSDPQHLYSTVK
jgi:hypothetical protein